MKYGWHEPSDEYGLNELAHGFYELELDQPARITVIQTDPGTPSPIAEARITDVAPNIHPGAGRGQ